MFKRNGRDDDSDDSSDGGAWIVIWFGGVIGPFLFLSDLHFVVCKRWRGALFLDLWDSYVYSLTGYNYDS